MLKPLGDSIEVLLQRRVFPTFLAATFGLAAFYALLFGMYTIPVVEIGFPRSSALEWYHYAYLTVTSVLGGGIVALYRAAKVTRTSSTGTTFLGAAGGFIGAVCPSCLGVNIVALGSLTAIHLTSLIPYIPYVMVGSIALLFAGFWLTAVSVSSGYCATCVVPAKASKRAKRQGDAFSFISKPPYSHGLYVLVAIALLATGIQAAITVGALGGKSADVHMDSREHNTVDLNTASSVVTPQEGFVIDATWGTVVGDMVEAGVLDPQKIESIVTQRYGQQMKPEWKTLLQSPSSDAKLTINGENAVFMMYVLWVLGKHNDNSMLHDSDLAQYFEDYDIGAGKAGYGDTELLTLTPEQQVIAENVASNAYRPCCGQSTAQPDCSHGFALLGLIELMAAQGYGEAEIFDAALKFNSFWFPAHYIQAALYFKLKENKDWSDVDPKVVMSKEFSTIRGSHRIKSELQKLGV